MSDFERPELLYLAGTLSRYSEGARRRSLGTRHNRCSALLPRARLRSEDADLVAWLVDNHLTMSLTAQKQDISDPDVVRAFAQRVSDERHLIALYLLTVADIRGTSPKVWNAWKGKLLEDLYHLTRRLLSGDTASISKAAFSTRQEEALAKLRLYALPAGAHAKLWSQLDTAYFLRHDAEEIAWHTRLLYYRVRHAEGRREGASVAGRRRLTGDDLRAGPERSVRTHLQLFRAHQLRHTSTRRFTRRGTAMRSTPSRSCDPDNR